MDSPRRLVFGLVLCAIGLATTGVASGLEHVTLRHEKQEVRVSGRLLVEAQDGGMLVEGRDGTIWTVEPDDVLARKSDDTPFKPLSSDELGRQLLAELPQGFEVHQTSHYVICYNTSREYAQWCGSLFERLYMAFTNYWSRKGFELTEPEFPLCAIVFSDKRSYEEHAKAEVGELAGSIIGYFSLRTNRMTMYDLTGIEALGGTRGRSRSATQISRTLALPQAEAMVATIVHEATHQIAFNCGLQTRYSDCPMWFSEGIAMYFETPDLSATKGWSTAGGVNRPRLAHFQKYLRRREPDSLTTLLTDDKRIRDAAQCEDAYAEAWSLTYFLMRQKPKQYLAYLKILSSKKPMRWDDAGQRLADFKQAFGDELGNLDAEFTRYMSRLR